MGRRSRSRSPKASRHRKRSRSRERKRSRSKERKKSRDRSRNRQHPRRSRSRDRYRSRSRSAEARRRSQSPTRKSRRSRSGSPSKKLRNSSNSPIRIPSKSPTPPPINSNIEGAIVIRDEPLDKEADLKRLEDEMQKRRERIEQWRKDRVKDKAPAIILPNSVKKWSLEDDGDDEEEEVAVVNEENEDEPDPLDAFMQGVNDEVKKNKFDIPEAFSQFNGTADDENSNNGHLNEKKMTIVSGIARKKDDPDSVNKKGELMEENADALEYSSEEEEETLAETMAGINKKKKELGVADHAKIYYRPYKKDFYVEVPEVAKWTEEDVIRIRSNLEGINIRGKNPPKPILKWAHTGVHRKMFESLKRSGFEKPTPIQCQAIPSIMSGRDIIGIAKTGSGKTLAFVLPMLRHIMDQPELDEEDGPIGVILTPTRELALQISKDCKKFTKSLNLNVVCVYGGTGISEQIAELKRGAEIIVCTPGRMIDMLAANNGRVTNLRRCTYIVLDEADRMFDMGFEPQVMRIIDNVRPDRQTVMFSATFPRTMEALARRVLNKPLEIMVGGRSEVCADVEQHVMLVEDNEKFFKLLELLGVFQEKGSVLVFVDKQEHADELMKNLLRHSYPCMSLHGGIDQYDRDSILKDFKAGDVTLLIATSVAARGLDVKELILVVNYDCPNHHEDYVHRCGRTGRAGNKGFAYTFISSDQYKYVGDIIRALDGSGHPPDPALTSVWNNYKMGQEALGKKVYSGGGFHGKGFKFDETEAQLVEERRKMQKVTLGLQDSDDEDNPVADIDQQIEDIFASRKRVTDVAGPMVNNQQALTANSNQQKLLLAKRLASRINMAKNLGNEGPDITQSAAIAIMKGENLTAPKVNSKTIAEQMAEKINAKLGYRPQNEDDKEDEKEVETFKRYEEELEINDFPQTARWKVTSKEALAQICEYSEAGITVRGTYYDPKKEVKEGDRKLYLAIEATSEMAVQKAKTEITRLIKEELIRLQTSYQPINRGRYKVNV